MRVVLLLVPLLVLVGCGRTEFALTPLRLAIIAESHLGVPQTAVRAGRDPFRVEDVGNDGIGVQMLYPDGTRLTVVLLDSLDRGVATCRTQVREKCVVTSTGTLLWSRQDVGEEGPGSVGVIRQRGSQFVVVEQHGPVITGDPRRQELPVSVDTMLALAADKRITTRTSQPAERRDYFDDSPPAPPPL